MEHPIGLSIRGGTKVYPGTIALKSADFDLHMGAVNVLVGENGAGKSTMMKVIAGVEQLTEGQILLNGEAVVLKNTDEAARHGIGIVFQESFLFSNTVAANIAFGHPEATSAQIERAARIAAAQLVGAADVQAHTAHIGLVRDLSRQRLHRQFGTTRRHHMAGLAFTQEQHFANLGSDLVPTRRQRVTRGLVVVFVLLCLGAVGTWIARHPAWTLKGISVQGDLGHQNAVGLRAQLATPLRKLEGSFLTLDLQQVRQMFEAVPWVRQAVVQREFPNRLRVTLQEHQAVAWWGESGSGRLVNELGEVFEASPDDSDGLPELVGPPDQSAQVWALYQLLSAELARLELGLARLELTERGSWRAELSNGARLELGRGDQDVLTIMRTSDLSVLKINQLPDKKSVGSFFQQLLHFFRRWFIVLVVCTKSPENSLL